MTLIAIVTVFAEGFNAGIKAAQTSAELDAITTLRRTVSDYDQSLRQPGEKSLPPMR